uniref:Myb-like domain-containing protein n=1 Tax=Brassica oleracea TaxID=3712 RepID=A0A3P6E8M4_BRAOL|nr:unnamed protein product [Brassica oleracea]
MCLSMALLDGDIPLCVSPRRRPTSLCLSSKRKTMKAKRHEEDSPDKGVQCNRDCVDIPSSQDTPAKGKERRAWTPTDDLVLISSWLNTSKDPLVGNEQKSVALWTRIAAYFSASPKLAGCEKREAAQCKHRWQKINDLVCKMMFSNKPTRSSSTTITRSSPLNMLGRSFEMIRSGVMLRRLKRMETCEDGSHTGNSQAIGTEKLVKRIKPPNVPWV